MKVSSQMNQREYRNKYEENDFKLLIKLIENSDLNNPNNDNLTCLHLLVEKYLWEDQYIFDLLKKKLLNIFIKDNNNETVYDKILNMCTINFVMYS